MRIAEVERPNPMANRQIIFGERNMLGMAGHPGHGHAVFSRPAHISEARADPGLIARLMEMGFSKSMCKAALKKNGNNFERALDKLLENPDPYIGVEKSDSEEEQM
jgi:hypothetical protein